EAADGDRPDLEGADGLAPAALRGTGRTAVGKAWAGTLRAVGCDSAVEAVEAAAGGRLHAEDEDRRHGDEAVVHGGAEFQDQGVSQGRTLCAPTGRKRDTYRRGAQRAPH